SMVSAMVSTRPLEGGRASRLAEFAKEEWRRRPDLNRGWRFCRPLPYLLATAPENSTRPSRGRGINRIRGSATWLANRSSRFSGGPPSPRLRRATFACDRERRLERETGFEPATSTLARSHSTTELFPPEQPTYHTVGLAFKPTGRRAARARLPPATSD